MKILYIARTVIPSRTANSLHVMKMCQALAKNGHNVNLLLLSENNSALLPFEDVYKFYAVDNCFHIIHVPVLSVQGSRIRFLFSSIGAVGSIIRKVKKINPDLVYGRYIFGCCASAFIGKKVVFESHFPVWYGVLGGLSFRLLLKLRGFKKLVLISQALKDTYLAKYKNLDPLKVLIAHDAADKVTNWQVCDQWPGRSDALQVGYVGHLYQGKGIEVIAAIAHRLPDVDFHIIGGLEHDITHWQGVISEDNVFFHGFISQDKLSPYINSLDVCLLPNQKKALAYGSNNGHSQNISAYTSPLKLFEYMAHKKAIISSDLNVLREVLNERNSVLVIPDDIHEWKNAIVKLKNAELRKKIGQAAYSEFIDKYTWDIRARRVIW
jgi:glycosyltransferase involved in cell wall biosynthesis